MARHTLTINGTQQVVEAPSDMPLLTVLRELLGVTGPKYGCGKGVCGACLCHVDGRPAYSCIVPVGTIDDAPIATIEGLAGPDALHPVQEAWIDEDVAQCGFCQQGQIMRAVALLAENPDPDDTAIDAAMSDVICRCGTYVRIRAAIKRAAKAMAAQQGVLTAPE